MRKSPLPVLLAVTALIPATLPAETSSVRIKDQAFDSLQTALEAAAEGDVLNVSGSHAGNFTIGKALTLSGVDGATLDGQGKGTVLTITADGVVVRNLEITNSGDDSTLTTLWGDAGVKVDGDKAMLSKLTITECDWGVIFFGNKEGTLTESTIEDCRREGLKVLGGEGHLISKSQFHRNQSGVVVSPRYGNETELVLPDSSNPAQTKRVNEFFSKATSASNITIEDNVFTANSANGIQLASGTGKSGILRNKVSRSGKGNEARAEALKAQLAVFTAALGLPDATAEDSGNVLIGTGILLSCQVEENEVIGNHCEENCGPGLALIVAHQNRIEDNLLNDNLTGLYIERSNHNQVHTNQTRGNTDYGIALGVSSSTIFHLDRSTENLITRNTLSGNGTNAYDATTEKVSREQVGKQMENFPIPQMPGHAFDPEQLKKQFADSAYKNQKPGTNHWHDGKEGNHYDDFDEESEGFKDDDEDGVSEAPRSIPGGKAVDEHPLKAEKVKSSK